MKYISHHQVIFFLILVCFTGFDLSAEVQSSGQNPLKPAKRIDFRYTYENLKEDAHSHQYQLRGDKKIDLDGDIEVGLRADLNVATVDEHDHGSVSGLGDTLLQALAIKHYREWGYGFGLRTILPTASETETGGEKWDLAPTLGISHELPELGHKSFTALIVRHRFSVAGTDNRSDRNRLEIEPKLNIHVTDHFFVDINLNTVVDFEDDNKWEVPLGIEIGQRLGQKFIVAVEPEFMIVDDAGHKQFSVEARVGYFF